jgi:two-component system, LytTR family, response regulator
MIKAILIDDEPLARSILKEYLTAYQEITVAEECNDGFEGMKAIVQQKPELIFLDIQMPKINGFEMLELIEEPPAVIFTTAFDEFAMRAFESNAVDYLLKPFSKERFERAINKFLDQYKAKTLLTTVQPLLDSASASPQQRQRVVVKTGGKIKIIPMQEIKYIEAADDYVKVITHEGSFLKNNTMSHFERLLEPQQFVRVHRSFILNISYVTRIDPYEKDGHLAILKDGEKIPVSKNGYMKLKQVLGL